MADYQHAEAFCLMKYRSDDGTEEELIWNSRDGVTPFVITLRSGKRATHVDWQGDQRIPDYQPPAGSRMFVDLTPERAREIAEQVVDQYLSDPTLDDDWRRELGSRDQAVEDLAASYLEQPGAPDIAEADPTAPEASRWGARLVDDKVRININGQPFDFEPRAAAELAQVIRVILGLETPDA